MPFGVTAAIAGGLVSAGIGATTAGILAAGIVGAGAGAIIGGATAAFTGGNIGKGALMGGLGGAVTGGVGGALGGGASGAAGGAAEGAGAGASDIGAGIGGAAGDVSSGVGGAGAGIDGITNASIDSIGSGFGSAADSAINGIGSAGSNIIPLGASAGASGASGTAGGILDQLGSWAMKNPLDAAKLGAVGVTGIQSLMQKNTPVDVNANKNNVLNGTGFNGALPKYNMTANTGTPYTGNWYTYGQTPQVAMYNSTAQLAMKHGGRVHGYAGGGMPMPMTPMTPAGPSPLPGGPPMGAAGGVNPLATHNGFAIGKAIGQHLQASGVVNKINSHHAALKVGSAIGHHLAHAVAPRGQGPISGAGGGQDDLIPTKLSDGEFVIPADVVADLGDGSSKAGGTALQGLVSNVRKHKVSNGAKFPPKAKSPLSYLPKKGKK